MEEVKEVKNKKDKPNKIKEYAMVHSYCHETILCI